MSETLSAWTVFAASGDGNPDEEGSVKNLASDHLNARSICQGRRKREAVE